MATLEQRVAALDEKTRKRLFSLCAWRRGERWIFATHDVAKGTELTTHYVDLFMTSE